MKLLRNETLRYKPIFPAGDELREFLIEFQLSDRIERLEEKTRRQAYKRAMNRQNRRHIREARQNGTNAPMIGSITPPGAPARAVFHDPRLAVY